MSCPKCGSDEFDIIAESADRIVDKIIVEFKSRGGFDSVFDELHAETFMELNCDLHELVLKEILRLKMSMKG